MKKKKKETRKKGTILFLTYVNVKALKAAIFDEAAKAAPPTTFFPQELFS
tara:strand:- start:316 stop:465 length:150 start_codon:yes stop_codon:yes gene_type:complete